MLGIPHEYLTPDLPGVGGVIKKYHEDFRVEEVPLYSPVGSGEHSYVEIEKTDLVTRDAIDRLARALNVDTGRFGYAGLKDRRGITRQVLSIALVPPERIRELKISGLRILNVALHRNKLRIGHLRGNRFKIRVRGVRDDAAERVPPILDFIQKHGMPNYYGHQRFGTRADAHFTGRAILNTDYKAAVHRFLGCPSSVEGNPQVVAARRAFMAGDWEAAHARFPTQYREELRALKFLRDRGEDYAGAIRHLRAGTRKLFMTSFQSYLFNLCLTERIRQCGQELERLEAGDLAYLHRNGAVFRVDDVAETQPRSDSFELSPTGPLFGTKMPAPQGRQLEIEAAVAAREGLTVDQVRTLFPTKILEGGRRPLRVQVQDLKWRLEEGDLILEFFLQKGAYATTFIRELTKHETFSSEFYGDGEAEKHQLWRAPESTAERVADSETPGSTGSIVSRSP